MISENSAGKARDLLASVGYASLLLSTFGVTEVKAESALPSASMTQIPKVSQLQDTSLPIAVNPMSQVTSVNQLRDVSPTAWAYEALRSLVERYGCIVGYPDRTYRGDRALTRWEFAAGLNACLNTIERLLQENVTILKEDLDKLKRLAEEFQVELATLGTRIDNLEKRVAFLEDHQFSTTTKLSGLVFMNLTGASVGGDVRVEAIDLNAPLELRFAGRNPDGTPIVKKQPNNAQITYSFLTWLTFSTSFTGKDVLVTQLAAGNGNSPANVYASAGQYNTFGVPFTDQTAGPDVGVPDVIIRELFYSFPLFDNLQIAVGPRVNWYRYFDNNRFTFFLNGAGSFNSGGSTLLNAVDRGAGAVVSWQIIPQLKLNIAYLGEADEFLPQPPFNTASDPSKGLFGGTNTTTAELSFSPSNNFTARFLYTYSNLQALGGTIGGAAGEPLYGVADAGPGRGLDVNPFDGGLGNSPANTFSVNFDWLITEGFGIFGRYSFGNTILQPIDRPVNAQAFQFGLGFPDLFKEGALGTFSFLVPFDVVAGQKYLVSNGGNGGTQYEFEATYYFPMTNGIALVPAVMFIGNPNNFSNNPGIFIGNMRIQYSF
jgi:Carbohydrate-selective porin, OprB family/S-layer homology domain